jgi:Flp pilus assembly protein TadG
MSGALNHFRKRPTARRGQALVEFGLTIGLFMLVIGGLVQFGLILWSQNSISEIARDTARYAVTLSDSPCDAGTTRTKVATAADQLARQTSLMSYSTGLWATAPSISALGSEGVGVDWQSPDSTFPTDCPPSDNLTVWTVRVRVNHVIPIFLPGLQIIAPPCGGGGFCITTETELRMEPKKP